MFGKHYCPHRAYGLLALAVMSLRVLLVLSHGQCPAQASDYAWAGTPHTITVLAQRTANTLWTLTVCPVPI